LSSTSGLELRRKEFLDELIALPAEGESEAVVLATYMHRHITAKKPLAALGGELGMINAFFFFFFPLPPGPGC
jgi:hypothetical protein